MPRQPMTEEEFAAGRTRILREAAAIMNRDGIAGLSMRGLAKNISLTPGALYRYFASKQEMMLTYWDESLKALTKRIKAIARSDLEAVAAIRGMLIAYAEFCLEDRDRFRLLFLTNDDGAIGDAILQTDGLAPYHLLFGRVEEALGSGMFLPGDARRVCNVLWAGIHGAVVLKLTVTEIDFGDAQDFVNRTIDVMVRGLSSRET